MTHPFVTNPSLNRDAAKARRILTLRYAAFQIMYVWGNT